MKNKTKDTFKYLLLSRGFRSVAIIYMSLAFSLYLNALHIDITNIGIIAALTMLFMIFLMLSLGFIGDRYGYKIEMLIAEVVAFLGAVIIGLSSSVTFIAVGMIIAGLGGGAGGIRGAFSPGSNAYIANNYKQQDERIKKFSYINVVSSLCAIIGSFLLIGVSIIGTGTSILIVYRYFFILSAAFLGVSALSILMLEDVKRPKKTTIIMKKSSRNYSFKVILANLFSGGGIGLVIPLLPLWFEIAYHASAAEIGAIFIVVYIATALGSYMSSKITNKFNYVNASSYTLIGSGLLFIAMAISPTLILAAVSYILRAVVSGFGNPFRRSVNVSGINSHDYGTATSIQGIASRSAQMSSGISGYLMDYSIDAPLFLGGVLQIFGGISYKLLFKNKKKK